MKGRAENAILRVDKHGSKKCKKETPLVLCPLKPASYSCDKRKKNHVETGVG